MKKAERIIDRIETLLKKNKVTPYKLEKDKVVPNATTLMKHWLTERQQPSLEVIVKISQYFNVTTDYLLGLDTENNKGEQIMKYEEAVELCILIENAPNATGNKIFSELEKNLKGISGGYKPAEFYIRVARLLKWYYGEAIGLDEAQKEAIENQVNKFINDNKQNMEGKNSGR
ncbi:MAG: helix-turn-helix domain-containing protein [Firmicutes bacterium]|nr:helix-turn-helix domain-containing protein [Bacillota bacterium]